MLRSLSGAALASLLALPSSFPGHDSHHSRTARGVEPALGIRIASPTQGQRAIVAVIDVRGGAFRLAGDTTWQKSARLVPPASIELEDVVSDVHIRTDAQSPLEITIVRGDSAIAPAGAWRPAPRYRNGAWEAQPSPSILARDIRLQRAGDTFRIISSMLPADKASLR